MAQCDGTHKSLDAEPKTELNERGSHLHTHIHTCAHTNVLPVFWACSHSLWLSENKIFRMKEDEVSIRETGKKAKRDERRYRGGGKLEAK